MIIQVDKDGKNVIEQLCDIALKQGGIQNLNQINLVLKTVTLIAAPQKKSTQKKKDPKKKLKQDV